MERLIREGIARQRREVIAPIAYGLPPYLVPIHGSAQFPRAAALLAGGDDGGGDSPSWLRVLLWGVGVAAAVRWIRRRGVRR